MAGKISAEMRVAQGLVMRDGLTAYEAAKIAGVTRGAIYMSQWYKDHMAQKGRPTAAQEAVAVLQGFPARNTPGVKECHKEKVVPPVAIATK